MIFQQRNEIQMRLSSLEYHLSAQLRIEMHAQIEETGLTCEERKLRTACGGRRSRSRSRSWSWKTAGGRQYICSTKTMCQTVQMKIHLQLHGSHLNLDNGYDIWFFYGRREPRLDLHITQVDEANPIYTFAE